MTTPTPTPTEDTRAAESIPNLEAIMNQQLEVALMCAALEKAYREGFDDGAMHANNYIRTHLVNVGNIEFGDDGWDKSETRAAIEHDIEQSTPSPSIAPTAGEG